MKKITLLLIAILTSVISYGQVKIKPGVKAGLNFSDFTNLNTVNNTSGNEGRTSFHIGGTVSFKFTDLYTLHPEVLYSEQGAELKGIRINGTSVSDVKIKANYLSFVVNNKFFLGRGRFNLQVAPVIDILVSNENINDPSSFDFSVMGGVGYNFPFGLNVDVRYKQGITDLFGRNVGTNASTTNINDLVLNQVFQLSLGYEFDL
ncbi:porin family protein [Tenacibaculum halocynthiae]|uniref:porin family protein n=1 Tax=Tenacibaculum halocynthiae TaxID=1254437 RepID=UPI00389636B6